MAILDYTDGTETDPNDEITVTAGRIDAPLAKGGLLANSKTFLSFDRTGDDLDPTAAVVHRFDYIHTSDTSLANAEAVCWMFADADKDLQLLQDDGDNAIVVRNFDRKGHRLSLILAGVLSGTAQTATLTVDTLFYCEVEIDPAVGADGTLYVRAYTDPARTSLFSSASLLISAGIAALTYRYFQALGSKGLTGDSDREWIGYVQNHDISGDPATPPASPQDRRRSFHECFHDCRKAQG